MNVIINYKYIYFNLFFLHLYFYENYIFFLEVSYNKDLKYFLTHFEFLCFIEELTNSLFLFIEYNIIKQKQMKRFQIDNSRIYYRPNNFDQMIRLKHDIEKQLYKEIIFPKICNKFISSQQERYIKVSPTQKLKDRSNNPCGWENRIPRYNNSNIKTEADYENSVYQQNASYVQSNPNSIYYKCTPINVVTIPRQIRTINRLQSYPRLTYQNQFRNSIDQEPNNYSLHKQSILQSYQTPKISQMIKKKKLKKYKKTQEQVSYKDIDSNINKMSQNRKKTNKRKYNPTIRRKFRVIVYAVFFTLLFPAYSRKIYKNRLKQLIKDYPHQIGKFYSSQSGTDIKLSKYKRDQQKLWSYIHSNLNLQHLISKSSLSTVLNSNHEIKNIKETLSFLIKVQMEDTQKSVDFTPDYEQQILYHKNLPIILQGCQNIIIKVVKQLINEIKSDQFFHQRWQTFSLGVTHNEFYLNSHPKLLPKILDSGLIQLHPTKQTLFINNTQTQIILLTYDIFARLYCYKWMSYLFKLKKDSPQLQKYICTANIYLSLIYFICEKMMDDYLRNNKISQKNIKNKQRNKCIRPILPLILKQTKKRDQKLLNTLNLIANPPLKDQISTIIDQNPQFAQKMANYLKLFGRQLHKKLGQYKKQNLKMLKATTLGQKNLIQDYLYEKQPIKVQK